MYSGLGDANAGSENDDGTYGAKGCGALPVDIHNHAYIIGWNQGKHDSLTGVANDAICGNQTGLQNKYCESGITHAFNNYSGTACYSRSCLS